ncbi:hypothetical protein SDC9_150717 [bioreactor metagenome]|uniref:Uncharacterized protein n=1 Tax=bioreactor metagenome TaxID=1076179 RepID=A0A645ENV7_9ZZZZ
MAAVDFFHKGGHHGAGARGDAAGGHADHDAHAVIPVILAQGDPFQRLLADVFKFLQGFHSNIPPNTVWHCSHSRPFR